ncbi:TetR/AcrR family transcriptional regulator [Stackebrandtia nassauensis]|uniref:TetR/AcrR family transcriptional regulator n=1 Tax=Stackebrandtia nassauensis TaxID=283811 RepID=UPI001B7FBD5B|nr:TetR/AcrR family transcriptional regulator [Stackebrandtia nassauensis]
MNIRSGRRDLLEVAAEVLTTDPTASLGDVAAAAGISRTTLHSRYPKRDDLLLAVSRDAVARISEGIAEVGLPGADGTAAEHADGLRRLIATLVPLGARMHFLLRHSSADLDADLAANVAALDEPIDAFVREAQRAGVVKPELAPWWVISTLYSLTYAAWDGVAAGRLAPLDAPSQVFDTLLGGIGGGAA